MKRGMVYLVGGGPGAPGLITARGLECLRRADTVIYDNLCNPSLLREAPENAEIVFAGKHSGLRTLSQERIQRLMVHRARAGKTIVRLKGGDPFVFGRGAEEAEALRRQRITFEVVPGVTSAVAVPAWAGIPVTHRDHSSAFAVVTAYEDPEKSDTALDYHALARFSGTLVILMGVKRMGDAAKKLMDAGKSPRTPVALVRWGTRGFQQTLTGELGNIAARAARADFRPPAVAVIGDVVRCRGKIQWVERCPLFGRRVVLTRSREQAGEWASHLRNLGAEVLEFPTIEIQRMENARVRRAARLAGKWDWVIFTSRWAVDFFLDAIMAEHGDLRALTGVKLAVVGEATAARLKARGLKPDLKPQIQTAKGLCAKIRNSKFEIRNSKALLPRSEIAWDELEKTLRALGAAVEPLVIYRNRLPRLTWELDALKRMIEQWSSQHSTLSAQRSVMVMFTSSSTAANFVKLLRGLPFSTRKLLKKCRFISIGPTTSGALRRFGMKVHAEAKTPSLNGLVQVLKSAGRRPPI